MLRAIAALPFVGVALVLAVTAQAEGDRVRVAPAVGVAGHYGTWTVTWTAGAGGLRTGGALRVQLPDTWHAGERNSANRLQATDPQGDHYVSARVSRPGARVAVEVESESPDFLVKSSRPGLDGRLERYVFVVRATLVAGELAPGDTIDVVYGDTSRGSRGMRAAIVSTEPERILVSVDRDGGGAFAPVTHDAALTSRSGIATELLLTGPSTLVVGEPAELRLAAVDLYANPVPTFREEVALQVVTGDVDLPATVRFPAGQPYGTVPFTPRSEGIVRVEAVARAGLLRARGNPMQVHREAPSDRMYWGDLHSHTRHSFDGVGSGVFDYARRIAGLDFHAVTDHSRSPQGGFTRGLGPHVWDEHGAAVEVHNAPGAFVTFHAYEASFPAPYGHHNVFFRGAPGLLLAPERVTLPELWRALEAGEALTIPHHTGKFPAPLDVAVHDPERRRNFEIYSAHGSSEDYDPSHPLAFEQSDFTNYSTSAPDGLTAQDAWAAGLRLSTVAASDDHRSHPGQPHWGLAAVRAPALTRDAIFDALYERRTYATTGARILLDFRVNGAPMGSEAVARAAPRLELTAHGRAPIERIEILRHSAADGFRAIHDLRPDALDFAWAGIDSGFRDEAIYYVRLQERGQVRGRVVMAWSSPVWVRQES